MAQTSVTVKLGEMFPQDNEFRILVDNEITFNCRYDHAAKGFRFIPLPLGGITGKFIPTPVDVDSYQLALLNMRNPAIKQSVTCNVIENWIPVGYSQPIVIAKLGLTPQLGDLIEFEGVNSPVYTVIELPHANGLDPWTIFLDRPLERPLRCDQAGFVTEAVTLRKYHNADIHPRVMAGFKCDVAWLDKHFRPFS